MTLPPNEPTRLSEELDALCDVFETALRGGEKPKIEEFLERVQPSQRERLFRELLEIELELRQQATTNHDQTVSADGETSLSLAALPNDPLAEYKARFPDYIEQVAQVVHRVVKPKRLGDYELLEELGHGGMGVVYRAVQKYLHQIVALKVLPGRLLDEPQVIARFRREMRLIGGLNHPNIVRALNAGESEGTHYLVMEYVDGVTLQSLLRAGHGMPVAAACEVIRQAALGLEHVHRYGLVHRDIKPANLMVDAEGIVKILDLGLGKFRAADGAAHSLTQIGATMGTVDYMAPEQWEDSGDADIRADIYSLGCTFYFLLTGRAPYDAPRYDSQRKKMMAHMVGELPSLDELVEPISMPLETVFEKMMAKEPADRFSTPLELAEAIEPFADFDILDAFLSETLKRPLNDPNLPRRSPSSRASGFRGTRTTRKTGFSSLMPEDRYSRLILLLLVGSLFIILCGIVGLRLFDSYHHYQANNAATRIDILNEREQALLDRIETTATALTQLPGLSGPWWFSEVPWYLPFLRETIDRKLNAMAALVKRHEPEAAEKAFAEFIGADPMFVYDPNTQSVYQRLWTIADRCLADCSLPQQKLVGDMRKLADSKESGKQQLAALQEAFNSFDAVTSPKENNSKETVSATTLHTRALLLHRLAMIKSDKALAEAAEEAYLAAITAYEREASAVSVTKKDAPDSSSSSIEKDPTSLKLRIFCQADLAVFYPGATGRFDKSLETFQTLTTGNREIRHLYSDLFRIALLASYGDIAMSAGQYKDEVFDWARSRIGNNPQLAHRTHPLAAHVEERSAWSLIDQWKIDQSAKHFREALRMRETNFKETGGEAGGNTLARIYIFHNRHGLAMTLRYQGKPEQAMEEYEKVFREVDHEIARIDALPPDRIFAGFPLYRDHLLERGSNARERYADCLLYSGAASNLQGMAALGRAATAYEKAWELAGSDNVRHVMACKLSIIRSLQGRCTEAASVLQRIDEENCERLGSAQRGDLVRLVAESLCQAENDPVKTNADLRTILNKYRINQQNAVSRETLEIRLLCTEYLLAQLLKGNDKRFGTNDLSYLQVLRGFARPEMRPFLQRFFDLAIRVQTRLIEPDNEQKILWDIAEVIRSSRAETIPTYPADPSTSSESGNKSPSLFLFYFSPHEPEGFALFVPQDSRPLRKFTIPYSRTAIRKADSLPLPPELEETIAAERREGRQVEISWSDKLCWAMESDALTDDTCPFPLFDRPEN